MTSPAVKTPGLEVSNDPLDTLLARLLASTSEGSDDDSKGVAGVPKTSARGPMRAGSRVEDHDPWKALSDQVDCSLIDFIRDIGGNSTCMGPPLHRGTRYETCATGETSTSVYMYLRADVGLTVTPPVVPRSRLLRTTTHQYSSYIH